jgi:catechol 2,3-dioxygenase-like lactoylglutathione lyase family enzyme
MSVRGLDHLAITVADIDATLDFYRRVLGAEVLYEDLYRSGKIPVVLLQIGGSRLSVHSAAKPAAPHAEPPTPGSGDFCFRWDAPLAAAQKMLAEQEVPVVEGPVPRPAADGTMGQSIYFRDPDQNLVELLSTVEGE